MALRGRRVDHALAVFRSWQKQRLEEDPVAAWRAFLADDAAAPARTRRHPGLLEALLREAGRPPLSDAERHQARRWRLRTVTQPVGGPRVRCTRSGEGLRLDVAAAWQCVPTADLPVSTAECLRKLLETWCGRTTWCAYTVQGLGEFVRAHVPDVEAMRTLDGPGLLERLEQCATQHDWNVVTRHGVRAALWRAKTHPDVDVGLVFQTHLHAVPRAFLDAHPRLWEYPVCVAQRWWRTVPDPADVDHLLLLLHDLTQRRLLRLGPGRDPQRTRDSLCRRLLWVLYLIAQAQGSSPPCWRTVLPCTIDRDGLIRLLARSLAAYHASPRRRHRHRTTPTVTDPRRLLLSFFRGAIADGVFEPTIPSHTRLDPQRLNASLLEWEACDPQRYRAVPPELNVRERPNLTQADVDALAAACRTPRERALVALLSTTGVRCCAVGAALLTDVWDAERGEVRPRVHFREKNSQVRTVTPNPELREALRAYVLSRLSDDHPPSPYLFPGARRPGRPAPFSARTLLRTLCRRAGLSPPFTPHQFRHYIVNSLMARGHRLECVSRWLGHKTPTVTYRHYWTDHEVGIQMHRDPVVAEEGGGGGGGDGDSSMATTEAALYEALQAKVQECEMLRQLLLAGVSPPATT